MLLHPLSSSIRGMAVALLSTLLFDDVQGKSPAGLNTTEELTGFPPVSCSLYLGLFLPISASSLFPSNITFQCDALINAGLSHAVHPASSSLYPTLVKNGSWALSTQKEPWCFVLPSTPDEVSETISALRKAGGGTGDWHVAVRSGGHGSDGSNNIALGVTIDLTQLNSTTYDPDPNVASIGTGARWGSVYEELEEHGVSVPGGRESIVGVGGLTLGGGISWYAAKKGFTCDSVVNFEIVLSNGDIVNANASANADLWRGLKGGSSNFGIVTRFDIEAFPAKNLSIERTTYSAEYTDDVIDAVVEFTERDESYADNAMISILTYDPKEEKSFITVTGVNTVNRANSTAFDVFRRIPAVAPGTKESMSLAESSNRSQLDRDTL